MLPLIDFVTPLTRDHEVHLEGGMPVSRVIVVIPSMQPQNPPVVLEMGSTSSKQPQRWPWSTQRGFSSDRSEQSRDIELILGCGVVDCGVFP